MKTFSVLLLTVVAASISTLGGVVLKPVNAGQEGEAKKAEAASATTGKSADKSDFDWERELKRFLAEEPAEEPQLDEVEALRDHVKFCEGLYKSMAAKAVVGAHGADRLSLLQVRFTYLHAKARLAWAEGQWAKCREEASAAVRTAKTIFLTTTARYEPPDARHGTVAQADAHEQLTEARLLLAKASARERKMKGGAERNGTK